MFTFAGTEGISFLYTPWHTLWILSADFGSKLDLYDFTTIPCACWFAIGMITPRAFILNSSVP